MHNSDIEPVPGDSVYIGSVEFAVEEMTHRCDGCEMPDAFCDRYFRCLAEARSDSLDIIFKEKTPIIQGGHMT
jgi:hypothetical protein